MKTYVVKVLLILMISMGVCSAQTLNFQDGVRVTILNISDNVTGDYFIQKDSTLQLPYIGNLKVLGEDYSIVKQIIVERYEAIYRDLEIDVKPLLRINVLGEVNSPGEYYITGVESVTDILARAGGETQDADLSEIILTRNGEDIELDVEEMLESGNQLDDIKLQAGDRIYVTAQWLGGARNTQVVLYAVFVVAVVVGVFAK